MSRPRIAQAVVTPGHDGQAELVLTVTYPGGTSDTVTLDAGCAEQLMRAAQAETLSDLSGQPWEILLPIVQQSQHLQPQRGSLR